MTWHWQEKYKPVDVEDACRQQILKARLIPGSTTLKLFPDLTLAVDPQVQAVPYRLWLKEKNQVEQSHVKNHDDDNQDKQIEIDAAFQDWLRRKQSSKKQQKKITNADRRFQPKPWCKPPSLHVNPKTKKASTRKAPNAKPNNMQHLPCEHTEVDNQQAYNAWLARVRLEDRVRQTQRRDELDRLEQQQRDKHTKTWRKKVAVGAYSTLVPHS
ncbi:hypothetical protein GN244_ATG00870 [Phytophthora infestans]|uniref:Uncharacterized protein n=1 Tax=Phytophthora infestans TaxID=4787 RepID=A0A833SDJ9_PHYIN|nr:hypothetical protein GN244_ATG00870 [Phytophthora infestans]KAF4130284.1 hypothetical protein GN958_ATG20699 [Phytophthora infestans]